VLRISCDGGCAAVETEQVLVARVEDGESEERGHRKKKLTSWGRSSEPKEKKDK
jgi:hypothetical protein